MFGAHLNEIPAIPDRYRRIERNTIMELFSQKPDLVFERSTAPNQLGSVSNARLPSWFGHGGYCMTKSVMQHPG